MSSPINDRFFNGGELMQFSHFAQPLLKLHSKIEDKWTHLSQGPYKGSASFKDAAYLTLSAVVYPSLAFLSGIERVQAAFDHFKRKKHGRESVQLKAVIDKQFDSWKEKYPVGTNKTVKAVFIIRLQHLPFQLNFNKDYLLPRSEKQEESYQAILNEVKNLLIDRIDSSHSDWKTYKLHLEEAILEIGKKGINLSVYANEIDQRRHELFCEYVQRTHYYPANQITEILKTQHVKAIN